nr:glycosyltransferase [Psychroflexus aestuariivivens]
MDSEPPFYSLHKEVKLLQSPEKITRQNKKIRFFTNGGWLRKTVKEINPDVICSFGEKYNPYVMFFLAGIKTPIYLANRTSPLSSLKGRYGLLNPFAYKFAAGVLLQTKQSIELLKDKYDFKRTEVIGNPIDLDYPKLERENIILNVGSIGGNKNQDWLIRYFSELKNKGWKLHFAGDGPLKQKCSALAEQLNIASQVVFHGVVKDIKSNYSRASIFAFTSTVEGFPNALGEAMAAGCACIAYDCIAGPSDIIDDGVNGFLIPVGDHELFQDKLKHLMQDQALREKFGKNAREKMKLFEADQIAEKFYQFITADL